MVGRGKQSGAVCLLKILNNLTTKQFNNLISLLLCKTFLIMVMVKYLLGSCLIILLFASCKKDDVNFANESINDYYPLQVGNYITYNLDSTVTVNFGQGAVAFAVNHYQAMDVVDAPITDNIGRPGFRIIRYLRTDSSQPWSPNDVFMAIPTKNSIEYVEDNLRFLKLMMPIKQNFSWKGNSYLPTNPYLSYSFSNADFMDGWDYIYDSIGVPLTINAVTIDSTLKVAEMDYQDNDPTLQPDGYAERTYSVEKYGKGIGLIYKEFIHWEYQPPLSISPGYTGFGIKMSITGTGHN